MSAGKVLRCMEVEVAGRGGAAKGLNSANEA